LTYKHNTSVHIRMARPATREDSLFWGGWGARDR